MVEVHLLASGFLASGISIYAKIRSNRYKSALNAKKRSIRNIKDGDYVWLRGKISEFDTAKSRSIVFWRLKEFLPFRSQRLASYLLYKATNSITGIWKYRASGISTPDFSLRDKTGQVNVKLQSKASEDYLSYLLPAKGIIIDKFGTLNNLNHLKHFGPEQKLPAYAESNISEPSKAMAEDYSFGSRLTTTKFGERKLYEKFLEDGDEIELVGKAVRNKDGLEIVRDDQKLTLVGDTELRSKTKNGYMITKYLSYIAAFIAFTSFLALTSAL